MGQTTMRMLVVSYIVPKTRRKIVRVIRMSIRRWIRIIIRRIRRTIMRIRPIIRKIIPVKDPNREGFLFIVRTYVLCTG